MKRVIIKVKGGLGNQMFQYAYGRHLQIKYGVEKLVLDVSECKKNNFRPYSLNKFVLSKNIEFLDNNEYKLYDRNHSLFLKIGQKFFPKLIWMLYKRKNVYIWDEESYLDINSIKDGAYLNGYWQSEKYFSSNKDIIKKEFEFLNQPSDLNKEYIDEIKQTNSVSLHIRLGDYCNIKRMLVCDKNYYFKACKYIMDNVDNPVFYVFSDEIESAKKIISSFGLKNIVFITGKRENYDDMYLMSNCKHFILSNSTFSWWAQYLSNNKNSIVCAPEKWTTDKKNNDIYMEKWVRI